MTTKERLHRLVDELSEAEADDALLALAHSHEHSDVLEDQRQRRADDDAIIKSYTQIPQEDLGALWAAQQSILEEPWDRNAPS